MRVLVAGSRTCTREHLPLIEQALREIPAGATIVHGDQGVVHPKTKQVLSGADKLAAEVAAKLGLALEAHPAKFFLYGAAAGPIRNTEMIASGVDRVIAFIDLRAKCRGTRDTIAKARLRRIPTTVIQFNAEVRP